MTPVPRKTSSKTRRTHNKSRNGCQECKQRHIKCDERRPTCRHCEQQKRDCSFMVLTETHQSTPPVPAEVASQVARQVTRQVSRQVTPQVSPPLAPDSSSINSNATTNLEMPIPGTVSSSASVSVSVSASPLYPHVFETVSQHTYHLSDMALLCHVKEDMLKPSGMPLVADAGKSKSVLDTIITSSLRTPYLMDQVLALAALHLSVLTSDAVKQHHYRHRAVQLHERAVALYHTAAAPVANDRNSTTTLCLFLSFLSMQKLYDTVNAQTNLIQLCDKFVQFADFQSGILIIPWSELPEIASIIAAAEEEDALSESQPPSHGIWDALTQLLKPPCCVLPSESLKACHDAVKLLQWTFRRYQVLPHPVNRYVVLSWPSRISGEYLAMIRNRRPEALVIMAHWALLLHRERDFWVFGQGGRFLIEAISSYLGTYWDKYMTPLREIMSNEKDAK